MYQRVLVYRYKYIKFEVYTTMSIIDLNYQLFSNWFHPTRGGGGGLLMIDM